MRYYDLIITPQNTASQDDKKQAVNTGVSTDSQNKKQEPMVFSTLNKKGEHNPNGLMLEFDIPVAGFHDCAGNGNNGYIRLHGIPISMIQQAANFQNAEIELYAGMSKGLPLVNPEQRGLIVQGQAFQSFGNWQGENTHIEFVLMPLASQVGNYTFQWKKGDKMIGMIEQVLKRNHPDYTVKSKIKDNLVLTNDESGAYSTISQFARYVFNTSRSIVTDQGYQGVTIIVQGKTIIVQDGSSQKKPKDIKYTDIIGQPTWLSIAEMQFKAVIRSDLFVGDFIKIPESVIKQSSRSMQTFKKNNTTFNGTFQISQIRHVGNSRQPDANSWCTIINCLEAVSG